MSAQFERISDSYVYTLPAVHISGDDPESGTRKARSGDIVHTRNGITLSIRQWASTTMWTLSFPNLTASELNYLRIYWDDRVFNLLPSGSPAYSIEVIWLGDFSPQYIGPDSYSLEATLESTV